ncbi:MAG: 2-oxoglutarate synthase [Desulfobacteraceae bacterium]|nr:2-oxoglutarate synthase [Desulfobacteraceae bacterium]
MGSFLNTDRPPVFCPGCAHERVTSALDETFQQMELEASEIVIVSDIGCSGLFDTFFNTHAFHGLHGRALTYATGLKLARPELTVIVTMGDGGLGIGGAHVLSACRRNVDLTLMVLNNFNYGMTGGQFSATTPSDAKVGSSFLNQLEMPIDACRVAASAGAGWVMRASIYEKHVADQLTAAIRYPGFSMIDLWGVCPGRYTKQNNLTPKSLRAIMDGLPSADGPVPENQRKEYGKHYAEIAAGLKPQGPPPQIEARQNAPDHGKNGISILGSAGQRIITAGEILCLAGMSAGLHATQKNDYPITVLRGHSVSELLLSDTTIGYTGIEQPAVVIAIADEGVARRKSMIDRLDENCLVIKATDVDVPASRAQVHEIDFKAWKIKSQDRALASLAVLAGLDRIISADMLRAAISFRFKDAIAASALVLMDNVAGHLAA